MPVFFFEDEASLRRAEAEARLGLRVGVGPQDTRAPAGGARAEEGPQTHHVVIDHMEGDPGCGAVMHGRRRERSDTDSASHSDPGGGMGRRGGRRVRRRGGSLGAGEGAPAGGHGPADMARGGLPMSGSGAAPMD